MEYLTSEEFEELGFEAVEDFDKLLKRASSTVNLFIHNFYDEVDFENDFEPRKKAIKQAIAYQIAYLDNSGVMTAEDKTSLASMTVGRTSVSYQNGSKSNGLGQRYNLSLDSVNWLKQAGFGTARVNYDR